MKFLRSGVQAAASANFGFKDLKQPLTPSDFYAGLGDPEEVAYEIPAEERIAMWQGFAEQCNRAAGASS